MATRKFEIPLTVTYTNGRSETIICAVRDTNMQDAEKKAIERALNSNLYKTVKL